MRRTLLLVSCALTACTSVLFPNVEVQPATDEDGDGVIGSDDQCPRTPEDLDGFRDTDGCHDPDDDGDAIADEDDRCRCIPEDRDGFEDDDGCPDLDDDRDRIADACDACPRDPETYDECADEDGCPDHGPIAVDQSRRPPIVAAPDTSCVSTWRSPCGEDGAPPPIDVCAVVADEED